MPTHEAAARQERIERNEEIATAVIKFLAQNGLMVDYDDSGEIQFNVYAAEGGNWKETNLTGLSRIEAYTAALNSVMHNRPTPPAKQP